MHQASQVLIGEHDFSAFRAAGCQAKSPCRSVDEICLSREGDLVILNIRANAFLYHMVRNIEGSLITVGTGEQTIEWFASVLSAKDRNRADVTASAAGLYFVRAYYSEQFKLPIESKKLVLL